MTTKAIRLTTALGLLVPLVATMGCSTTQKTAGGGLTSVVAQNVVRIACVQGLRNADLATVSGKPVSLELTGFTDDSNQGILNLLFRSAIEEAGGRVVASEAAELQVEVATMTAGNDQGRSSFPLITKSERTEGSVDVQMNIREIRTGAVLSSQPVHGEAKYQQTAVIGIQGSGKYFVKSNTGRWEHVPNPSHYR